MSDDLHNFLTQASDRLQFLRDNAGALRDRPSAEELDRLADTAQALALEAVPALFAEIAAKLAQVFVFVRDTGEPASGTLFSFIDDGITLLEADLLALSSGEAETAELAEQFRRKYPFAFAASPAPPAPESVAVATASAQVEFPPDADVPPDVLEFFVPEVEEHLQSATESLLALAAGGDGQHLHRLFRSLHTVKGSAAQVGLHSLAEVAHRAEDLVGSVRDRELAVSQPFVDLCLEFVDALRKSLHRQWRDDAARGSALATLLARIEQLPRVQADAGEPAAETTAAPVAPAPSAPSVRVSLERLERMMNIVGEQVINRTRLLGRMEELERLADQLDFSRKRLADKVEEFHDKYEFSRITGSGPFTPPPGAARGFSELELDRYDDFNILARFLAEISADVGELLGQLRGYTRRVHGDVDEFTRLARRLQEEINHARLVPIGSLYIRLARSVREAAKSSGKEVDLKLSGADTGLDNHVVQRLADPLLHLVRNAVAHGIESGEKRYALGKSDHGLISVRAYQRGNHVFVEVEDDGRGIDWEKVRGRALERGLLPGETDAMSEPDLARLLFQPGFSTAARPDQLAGRGVGLDVVRENLAVLDGEVDVESRPGQGTRFILKLPLTLMISQALFVRSGGQVFALPLALVQEIRRLPAAEISERDGRHFASVREQEVPVVWLDRRLGLVSTADVDGHSHLVLIDSGERVAGLLVDEVLRRDEVVIKPLGEYLRNLKLFPGATIAPDGGLNLMLDPERALAPAAAEPHAHAFLALAQPAAASAERTIVLADDSISVRKIVGRMLERAGYRVRLASDGLEALDIIAEHGCHLLLTDLEMPRTNGYELIATLRQKPATQTIPVVVVTSRASAKHRDLALHEGADAFLTKPVQEEELLETIERFLPRRARARSAAAAPDSR